MILKNGEKIWRKDLIYRANKHKYDFQQHETIRSFGESSFTGNIIIDEAEENQSNVLETMAELNNISRPKIKEGKIRIRNTFESVNAPYKSWELTLNAFKSDIFPIKAREGKRLKILTPK